MCMVYGAVGVLLVDIASTELAFSLDYFGLCLQYNEQNGDYDDDDDDGDGDGDYGAIDIVVYFGLCLQYNKKNGDGDYGDDDYSAIDIDSAKSGC